MKIKISDVMTYEEFLERYLVNKEEFKFKYKKYIIDLLYSSDGKKFAYYISDYIEKDSIFDYIKNRNKYLYYYDFDSPQELINNFIIDGKSFKEIWNELEWK